MFHLTDYHSDMIKDS